MNYWNFLLVIIILTGSVSANAQVVAQEAELLGRWYKSGLPPSSSYTNTYNEIWGLAVNGREYAVIGSTMGTHFIDVTDPAQAAEVAFVKGKASGSSIIHRDYHNYGCYLYAVCDEGASSLQIIDVSYLPDSVHVAYDSDALIRQSHNIFIDTALAKLYTFSTFGGPEGGSAMRIYDISEPLAPRSLGEFSRFGDIQTNVVHDGYVRDGIAYLNCANEGLAVMNFKDPANPYVIGTLTSYRYAGYNHSGWPTTDQSYYYLGDETHGFPLKAVDMRDTSNFEVVYTFGSGSPLEQSIPHNQIAACNYLYVSYYYDGLRVYDISEPAEPKLAWYYDTSIWAYDRNYRGAWGVYPYLPSGNILVSDMQRGLFILRGPGDDCVDRDISRLSCSIVSDTDDPAPSEAVVSIYPNPTRDLLNIDIRGGKGQRKVNVELLDLNGRLVERLATDGSVDQLQGLSIGHLPAGIYLLRLRSDDWQSVHKIIRH